MIKFSNIIKRALSIHNRLILPSNKQEFRRQYQQNNHPLTHCTIINCYVELIITQFNQKNNYVAFFFTEIDVFVWVEILGINILSAAQCIGLQYMYIKC